MQWDEHAATGSRIELAIPFQLVVERGNLGQTRQEHQDRSLARVLVLAVEDPQDEALDELEVDFDVIHRGHSALDTVAALRITLHHLVRFQVLVADVVFRRSQTGLAAEALLHEQPLVLRHKNLS